MPEKTVSVAPVNGANVDNSDTPVWGCVAIGRIINRSPRQTNHLLASGAVKSAKKMGNQWVALPSALRAEFGG
jgi:hypothetical protein